MDYYCPNMTTLPRNEDENVFTLLNSLGYLLLLFLHFLKVFTSIANLFPIPPD
jgi:hypothetical protein